MGLGEDRAHEGGNQRLRRAGHATEEVAHDVRATALPRRARQHRGDRGLQPLVRVARDELDACRIARHQTAQERRPRLAVLAGEDVEAQQLALAICAGLRRQLVHHDRRRGHCGPDDVPMTRDARSYAAASAPASDAFCITRRRVKPYPQSTPSATAPRSTVIASATAMSACPRSSQRKRA